MQSALAGIPVVSVFTELYGTVVDLATFRSPIRTAFPNEQTDTMTTLNDHNNCPMTVYYDRSCPLCVAELEALQLTDYGFELKDCSATDFHDEPATSCGITQAAMLESIHLRDEDGQWFKGVDAFEIIYRRTGNTTVANWLAKPKWRTVNERLYAFIARHKKWAAALGMHKPYAAFLKWHMSRKRHATQARR
ncbi:MAG: thiol-disulfide oxidoreductase DCC family protein [Gammaproteobacteria bacterium]